MDRFNLWLVETMDNTCLFFKLIIVEFHNGWFRCYCPCRTTGAKGNGSDDIPTTHHIADSPCLSVYVRHQPMKIPIVGLLKVVEQVLKSIISIKVNLSWELCGMVFTSLPLNNGCIELMVWVLTFCNNQKNQTYRCPNKSHHSFWHLRPSYSIHILIHWEVSTKMRSKRFETTMKVQLSNSCADALVTKWSGALIVSLVESELS